MLDCVVVKVPVRAESEPSKAPTRYGAVGGEVIAVPDWICQLPAMEEDDEAVV